MLPNFTFRITPNNRVKIIPEDSQGYVIIETPIGESPIVTVKVAPEGMEHKFRFPHYAWYPGAPVADGMVTRLDDDGYLILEESPDV